MIIVYFKNYPIIHADFQLMFIKESMFMLSNNHHFLYSTFLKSTKLILENILQHQVSEAVYSDLYKLIFKDGRIIILPSTMPEATSLVDYAIDSMFNLDYAQKIYYKTIATTLSNQATLLELFTILKATFLYNQDVYIMLEGSWTDFINIDTMYSDFSEIIPEFLGNQFAGHSMTDMCLNILRDIKQHYSLLAVNSVEHIFLQTLFEIGNVNMTIMGSSPESITTGINSTRKGVCFFSRYRNEYCSI